MQPQHMTALDLAQSARMRKAAVKEKIASEEVDPAEVARSSDLPFRVGELLVAVKGLGEVKARRICRETGLPFTGWVASRRAPKNAKLTDRQREVLAVAIEEFVAMRGTSGKARYRIQQGLAA